MSKKDVSPRIWRERTRVLRANAIRYGSAAIKATAVEVLVFTYGATFKARISEVFAVRYHRDHGVIATIGSYTLHDYGMRAATTDPDRYDFEPQIKLAVERWARLKLIDWIREKENPADLVNG